MNPILERIIKAREGHYCHALEVTYTYELESIVEALINEYNEELYNGTVTEKDIIDFFTTMSIYYLDDDELTDDENSLLEEELYSFNFKDYIKDTI